jgi:hypothetical protein
MKTSIERRTIAMALALGLAGCATTEPRPPGGTTGGATLIACERIPFDGPLPTLQSPQNWYPKKAERGVLHVRFFVAGGKIYAIGVPVVDLRPGPIFFVGGMDDLPTPFPPKEAKEYFKKHPDWAAFYHQLFEAYGDSRPLALVCRGPDCPTTPEAPPPGGLGMTATIGLTPPFTALSPSGDMSPLASLEMQGAGKTATDASPLAAESRSPDLEQRLRQLFSDTVSRAVCVARTVTPEPLAK